MKVEHRKDEVIFTELREGKEIVLSYEQLEHLNGILSEALTSAEDNADAPVHEVLDAFYVQCFYHGNSFVL